MNTPPRHPHAEPKPGSSTPPDALPEARAAEQRACHAERLARLFRLNAERADDRYLLNLVSRYRAVDSP